MEKSIGAKFFVFVFLTILVISGCAPAPTPTPTPAPTSTSIPPTSTPSPIPPTSTPEPTITVTATPAPVCNPGNTVEGTIDDEITPGFMDISKVSTSLDGTKLTLVMTLREIPGEITINRKELSEGQPEIALGVAIDVDNNRDTGGKIFLTQAGYGYDAYLQIFAFKMQGDEQTGTFEDMLSGWNSVAEATEGGGMQTGGKSTLSVDTQTQTITLVGDIKNISPDSYLHFYTFYKDTESVIDQLCQR